MDQNPIDWDDLKLALAVARGGGLSGGAKLLGINHATVFRRLNALEKVLGVRLFERFRDGYSATPAGERLVAMAERVEAEVIDASLALSGQDVRLEGPVRITTTEALLPLLGLCIPALTAANPLIVLELIIDQCGTVSPRATADARSRLARDAGRRGRKLFGGGGPPPARSARLGYGIYAPRPRWLNDASGKRVGLAALPMGCAT
jgi:molybdenum-dependent DNA-binding transcriptional regulator ModE